MILRKIGLSLNLIIMLLRKLKFLRGMNMVRQEMWEVMMLSKRVRLNASFAIKMVTKRVSVVGSQLG